jgi:hypothetical protein
MRHKYTDDGEYETQSDDTMTVDVESPEPSFAGISDDIEAGFIIVLMILTLEPKL